MSRVWDNGVLIHETYSGRDLFFHKRLQCFVKNVSYDFEFKRGRVDIVLGGCTDYTGCIEFFKAIDPDVLMIETFADGERDTWYGRDGDQWIASTRAVRTPCHSQEKG